MLVFPTVVFTTLLALVAAFWLVVIAGGLDVDALGDAGVPDAANADVPGLMSTFGLRGVPVTVSLSFFVLFGWATSLAATSILTPVLAPVVGGVAASLLVVLVACAAGLCLASLSVRPLRRLFAAPVAPSNVALVGKVCTVTTLRVNGSFGQAELEDGGAGLLLQVRAEEPNELTKGSRVLIFDYDADDGVYHVTGSEHEPDIRALERHLDNTR